MSTTSIRSRCTRPGVGERTEGNYAGGVPLAERGLRKMHTAMFKAVPGPGGVGQPVYTGLHVIAGCMYSGKSEELIRILSLWKHTGIDIEVYTHGSSVQTGDGFLKSRAGTRFPAQLISSLREIKWRRNGGQRIIAIDEAQFFDEAEAPIIAALADRALVIVAGLDTDFRGEPFQLMAAVLAMADSVTKLSAVCARCKTPGATFTQRLINGKPAPYESPRFMPGDADLYEPRCRRCYERPPRVDDKNVRLFELEEV
ncbi:MAG: thymidine kinase [Bacillota bacterium]|nr:MAG: thymidine kinase [Bacillota bacterium]